MDLVPLQAEALSKEQDPLGRPNPIATAIHWTHTRSAGVVVERTLWSFCSYITVLIHVMAHTLLLGLVHGGDSPVVAGSCWCWPHKISVIRDHRQVTTNGRSHGPATEASVSDVHIQTCVRGDVHTAAAEGTLALSRLRSETPGDLSNKVIVF